MHRILLVPSRGRRSTMANVNAGNEIILEMERMKRTIMSLQEQLAFAEDTITAMRLKERESNDRCHILIYFKPFS